MTEVWLDDYKKIFYERINYDLVSNRSCLIKTSFIAKLHILENCRLHTRHRLFLRKNWVIV